jgi:hypothetical protein
MRTRRLLVWYEPFYAEARFGRASPYSVPFSPWNDWRHAPDRFLRDSFFRGRFFSGGRGRGGGL